MTSLTVVLTLLALFLFGGSAITNFILILLIGIISGTYSSIFVASPLLVDWQRWDDRRHGRTDVGSRPSAARDALTPRYVGGAGRRGILSPCWNRAFAGPTRASVSTPLRNSRWRAMPSG